MHHLSRFDVGLLALVSVVVLVIAIDATHERIRARIQRFQQRRRLRRHF